VQVQWRRWICGRKGRYTPVVTTFSRFWVLNIAIMCSLRLA
jgi:hypothetical protein